MASINFVHSLAAQTSVTITPEHLGDTLIAIYAATSTTADFPALPSTIVDSTNQVWELIYSGVNQGPGSTSALYNTVAVYAVMRCNGIGTLTLDMVAQLAPPGDVVSQSLSVTELETAFGSFGLTSGNYSATNTTTIFQINGTAIAGKTNLVIGAVFDSALAGPPSQFFDITPIGHQQAMATGGDFAGVSDIEYGIAANVTESYNAFDAVSPIGIGYDVFGVYISLLGGGGGSSTGSSQKSLTFFVSKGPKPSVPLEGRAIASVQIDCTQQPVQPLPLVFPELTMYDSTFAGIQGATVVEFDLDNFKGNVLLSDVKMVAAWSRPQYAPNADGSGEDTGLAVAPGSIIGYPALLTNVATLQTIVLGPNAGGASTGYQPGGEGGNVSFPFQYQITPFPGNKGGLKYRFIVLQTSASNPIGKFTLNFMNFDTVAQTRYGVMQTD